MRIGRQFVDIPVATGEPIGPARQPGERSDEGASRSVVHHHDRAAGPPETAVQRVVLVGRAAMFRERAALTPAAPYGRRGRLSRLAGGRIPTIAWTAYDPGPTGLTKGQCLRPLAGCPPVRSAGCHWRWYIFLS